MDSCSTTELTSIRNVIVQSKAIPVTGSIRTAGDTTYKESLQLFIRVSSLYYNCVSIALTILI